MSTSTKRASGPAPSSLAIPKQYISDAEVEARYGIARKTLQNWRILGRGPEYRKFGSAVRYNVRTLEIWCDSQPVGGDGIPASAIKGFAIKSA